MDVCLTYALQQLSVLLAWDSWIWRFSCCDVCKFDDLSQVLISLLDPVSVAAFESEMSRGHAEGELGV